MAEAHERLISKLECITLMSGEDLDALRPLPISLKTFVRDARIVVHFRNWKALTEAADFGAAHLHLRQEVLDAAGI